MRHTEAHREAPITRLTTHVALRNDCGEYLAVRQGSRAPFSMPARRMGGRETPDFSALVAAARFVGTPGVSLTGGHSHQVQIPGAPRMLTRPHISVWDGMELHLYYAARSAQTPPASGLRLLDGAVWLPPGCLAEAELEAAGLPTQHLAVHFADSEAREALRLPLQTTTTFQCEPRLRELSVAVFVNCSKRTLLHYHAKARMWLPPGGHVEPGESPDDAALREVLEETGMRVELLNSPHRICPVVRGLEASGRVGRALARPEGIQIEKLGPLHEHIDFVYFSSPCPSEPRETPAPGFGWYGREDASRIDLTPEMRLWCQKVWGE